jgi:hypothetical protein
VYRWFRNLLLVLLVTVSLFTVSAYASSETNLSPIGGEGASMISGFHITNLQYRLANDPAKIRAVEFDLDGSATQVAVGFDINPGVTFNCRNVSGYHWRCDVDGVQIAGINELRVIALGQ